MKIIETMEQWNILKAALIEKGWRLWQMQYRWNDENGFHAFFWKSGKQDVEVVTHNQEIQKDIIKSDLE